MRRRRSGALQGVTCTAFSLLVTGLAAAQPSAPGLALLAATEQAHTVAIGRVTAVAALDRSAYVATLSVERILAGESTATLRVAWEELAHSRTPRLAPGDRVIVALDQLPETSLWRQRLPNADALTIAARADAYLVDPPATDVELLARYLTGGPNVSAAARNALLAPLVRGGGPLLASAAVARFDSADGLDRGSAAILMAIAADATKPLPLRKQVVVLLGHSRVSAIGPQLDALARPGSSVESDALTAFGTVNGGLAADRTEALLERPEPAVRAVGARFASGALAARRLPPLVRSDPSPDVRAAAARSLASTRALWGIDGALPALADPDPQVRAAAAQALAALGDRVVPTLENVAGSDRAEARGSITALALAGPAGQAAVWRVASGHRNERLRDYARLALGQGPHSH